MNKKKNSRKRKAAKCTRAKSRVNQTAKKFKKSGHDVYVEMTKVRIKRSALYELMNTVGSRPAETGGILIGPIGTNDITHFYFDRSGSCTGSTYSPDYITLRQKMREEWLPAKLDMKGRVHSHPGSLDTLTSGDMNYIKRLLDKNSDMDMFVAPIVLPNQYAIRPLVVTRDRMDRAQQAYFEIFD